MMLPYIMDRNRDLFRQTIREAMLGANRKKCHNNKQQDLGRTKNNGNVKVGPVYKSSILILHFMF